MSWSTAIQDIQTQLSDGAQDKHRYRKRCIGVANGSNQVFKTFEPRRVTNFTSVSGSDGVYVNGVLAPVTADDPISGEFTLTTAPLDSDVVEATYYYRWFLDTELQIFAQRASDWLLQGLYTDLPDGLKNAATLWSCKLACEKLAIKWAESMSDTYMLEDAPKDASKLPINPYIALASQYQKQAIQARNDFYTRSGEALAPLFGNLAGNVPDVTPKR